MAKYPIISEKSGKAIAAELARQTALMAVMADTTAKAAMLEDWGQVASEISEGLGHYVLPVGTQVVTPWDDVRANVDTQHQMAWNVAHYGQGALADGESGNVVFLHMDKCLPFDTQFSPYQAFLCAVTPIPAGTYHVTMGFSWGSNVVSGKNYQFTLAQDLPIGGQLSGFERSPDVAPSSWQVKAWASAEATAPTETVAVTEGAGGTSLGTFTEAGVSVPANGIPVVTTVGALQFYGLNSLHRVSYGNNRWLHSPLRQFLNAEGTGWWHPATVFDRPPSYVGYEGFLSGLPADFVTAMQPIAQVTALNYATDGGTQAEPAYDTTYDKVFLPSGKQHHIQATASFGGAAGLEGEAWEYWERVLASTVPAVWWQTYPEYRQYDLASPAAARSCWMRLAYRGNGYVVTYVSASGVCSTSSADNGLRSAAACAIGLIG